MNNNHHPAFRQLHGALENPSAAKEDVFSAINYDVLKKYASCSVIFDKYRDKTTAETLYLVLDQVFNAILPCEKYTIEVQTSVLTCYPGGEKDPACALALVLPVNEDGTFISTQDTCVYSPASSSSYSDSVSSGNNNNNNNNNNNG